MTRCSDCNRRINTPALVLGPNVYGPVCARRYRPAANERLVPAPVRMPRPRAVTVNKAQQELEFA